MFVLASASPRRQQLLKIITPEFVISPVDIDESIIERLAPDKMVQQLSSRKAQAALQQYPKSIVIGSDTLVSVDGKILGKPKDAEDAERMLKLLSGSWHNVDTGVTILTEKKKDIFSVNTKVKFIELSKKEIQDYIKSGEPMDKAGAYGIQEKGARFVSEIQGDFFSVMGLPVSLLYQKLKFDFGCENI